MRHNWVLKQIAAAGLIVTFAAVDMNSYAGTLVESGDDKNVTIEPEKKVDWGKINVNIRLRYEYAEDENLSPSNAFTGRLRLGYTTPVLWGFQAMAEFEGTGTPDESSYRAANISGPASKTNVPDPESYELNQLWASYTAYETMLKAGRQRIIYDNARFVGNVGWRQNEQTFDAALFQSKSITDLTLGYSYVNRVERIFGSEAFGPTSDFQSDSHLINVNYKVADWLSFTVYSYFLDLHNIDIDIGSKTFGGFATGKYPFTEKFSLSYRAEYANQSDWRTPASFDTNYVHAVLKGEYLGWSLDGGFELLSSDGGTAAFQTPLGTNHAFNGWADRFLTTPNTGLRDYYVGIGTKLPYEIGAGAIYHYFTDDRSGDEYGQEIDVYLKKDLGKGFSVLAEFAYYFGDNNAFPVEFQNDSIRAWFQIEYNY